MIPPVVSPTWWDAHRADVVLADVRWYLDGRSGRAAYQAGHLPGAVFVDLDRCLAAPPSPEQGRHPLPDPEVFAAELGRLGIGDDDTVVAYDDAGGLSAARLVWLLRATGHQAALLDGGLQAYRGELETEEPPLHPVSRAAQPWPQDRLASLDEVVAQASDGPGVVLDARAPERYRGEHEPVDPRAGHIPGARNLPTQANLAADGTFLPTAELRRRFSAAGVQEGAPVTSYCGSGVTACHSLLALELSGLAAGRLYPGSWSQYSGDPERPVATGG